MEENITLVTNTSSVVKENIQSMASSYVIFQIGKYDLRTACMCTSKNEDVIIIL